MSRPPLPTPPPWIHWLRRHTLRLGRTRAVLALTALVTLSSLAVTLAVVWALGGNPAIAAACVLASTLLLTPLIGGVLLGLVFDLEAMRAELDILAARDELTEVYNRRHFMVMAEREWARCRRYDMPAALLLFDADHFKQVNDNHGHLAGDLLLREIARAAGATLRQADVLGRFGGEEFIVFLPHADQLGALDAAERIRERVSGLQLEWNGAMVRTTVSVGVATLDTAHDTLASWIQDADRALYAAKDAGRNCVRSLPQPLPGRRKGGLSSPESAKRAPE